MDEIWKDIPNTNGYYQISNFGNARSVDREITYSNGTIHHHKGRPLRTGENLDGYLFIGYPTSNGKQVTKLIHRLVAMMFVDGYADGLEVNHKDENKHNNRADNLEWCTREYNNSYGSNPVNRSESYKNNSYAKRTKIVVVYRDGVKVGEYNGYKEAGEALGFTKEYISFIANGQRKPKHIRVEIKRPRSYRVGMYKDGKLIAVFPTMAKAIKAIGINKHYGRSYLGNGKTIKGYLLREIA